MVVSLVQEKNWVTSIIFDEEKSKSKSDLVCLRHKNTKATLLVHLIDGWIIEESNLPFDKEDGEDVDDTSIPATAEQAKPEEEKENEVIIASQNSYPEDKDELMALLPTKCKFCGEPLPEKRAMWGKRFCSVSCGKRYSVNCSNRVRRALHNKTTKESKSLTPRSAGKRKHKERTVPTVGCSKSQSPDTTDESLSSTAKTEFDVSYFNFPPRYPLGYGLDVHDIENELYDGVEPIQNYAFLPVVNWSISQVADYISEIPGCAPYVPAFEAEEIDGQALLLLKIEHLIHAMNIKLGPALKIAANVRTIKLKYGVVTKSKYLSSP